MYKLLTIVFCLIMVWGCSTDSNSSSPFDENGLSDDFIKINAAGKSVTLGTNDSKAPSKERPSMRVLLEQDFYIGKHEVTCDEFNAVMKNVSGLMVDCPEKNLPVTNVTFFDAVLYANAKSKAEKRDTSYSYKQVVFDGQRNCINMEGFAFHPEKEGYRLPTEAEWVFVANENWNAEEEWLSENAEGAPHMVCSLKRSEGACDMMGNVKEWVNDWMSLFRDSTISNFVGASNGGALGERVLKGGYYLKDASTVNLFSRGDIYTVTSVTKASYVGFRLACGAISDAVWVNGNGSIESNPVVPLANSTTIKSMVGSFKAKLAFRNDNTGNLAFIDYSQTSGVVEIQDTMEVYHPDISPDGGKVAFCTGLEGVAGKSALYVRNLDAEGSGLVRLDVESAAIPRWRVMNGDTVILYVSDAGTNKDDAAFLKKSTWMVPFSAGKFGKPVKLFDGAFHDGVSEDSTLAVTGSSLLRVKKAVAGKTLLEESDDALWYGGDQACNVSLSKDGTKRIAFLDFGGSVGTAFVGHSYKAHEFLLVADSTGEIVNMIQSPAGFTFDHTEWASGIARRANFVNSSHVVATLTNVNGAHSKIVLVNVENGGIAELVDGEELWHPNIWVKSNYTNDVNSQIDYDSAGVYYVDGGADNAKRMRYRMECFWKYKDSAEIMGLGSSRMSNGFDPLYLKAVDYPLNMGFFQSGFLDIYEFYRMYVHNNAKNLKYVVFSLDIDIWYYSDSDNFFSVEYKNYPGYIYDANHDYWRNSDYSLIRDATADGLEIDGLREVFGTNRSSLFDEVIGWGGENPIFNQDSGWLDYVGYQYEYTYNLFIDFLKMTAEDSIVVIGAIFPQAPGYKNMGTFGRHGLRRSEAIEIISNIENLQKEYPHFILMDENKMGDHDYTDDMAQDSDHLAPPGAKHFAEHLDSLIRTLKPLR